MTIVEMRRASSELRQAITEMRAWIGQHQVELKLFEVGFLPGREIRFRLYFDNAVEAEEFQRVFDGVLLDEEHVKLAA